MPSVEKISIALPQEMVAQLRDAVASGEYASTSEAVRDALRDWSSKRIRTRPGIDQLRAVWREALANQQAGAPIEHVIDRLERKYRVLHKQSDRAD